MSKAAKYLRSLAWCRGHPVTWNDWAEATLRDLAATIIAGNYQE